MEHREENINYPGYVLVQVKEKDSGRRHHMPKGQRRRGAVISVAAVGGRPATATCRSDTRQLRCPRSASGRLPDTTSKGI